MSALTPAIVAPVAWQNFGDWCLTGQHGMRPIYLSCGGPPGKKVMTVRDPETDRLKPLTPDSPVAQELVRIINSHDALVAALTHLREFLDQTMCDEFTGDQCAQLGLYDEINAIDAALASTKETP